MQGFLVTLGNGPLNSGALSDKAPHQFDKSSTVGAGIVPWSGMNATGGAVSGRTATRTFVRASNGGGNVSGARKAPKSRQFVGRIPLVPAGPVWSLRAVERIKMWVKV